MRDTTPFSRRTFLKTLAAGTAGAGLSLAAPAIGFGAPGRPGPADRVRVAIIGTGGRGAALVGGFARLPGVEVRAVCDVDRRRVAEAAAAVRQAGGRAPRAVADLRRVLDDREVDAVVVAAPDHWHTPASLMALSAGKHVYVEKPGSHNAWEAGALVEAAARSGRVVQMGNQRRSWPGVVEGIERVRSGAIGPVHYARSWYANSRGSIGRGTPGPAPEWLDFELWQGPAPRRPFRDNILHYNWHWFWHWGTAESGNNGVHGLDLCRWGLGVDHPVRVASSGGRYFFQDDQETPDTQVITFEFEGNRSILWEGLSCSRRGIEGSGFGASFHGEQGTLVVEGLGYRMYDREGKQVATGGGAAGGEVGVTGPGFDIDRGHLLNFVQAIRTGEPLRAPIADGQRSTLLCHLGNIAQRTGRTLAVDPATGQIQGDPEAMRFWKREYAPGWEPARP